MFKVWHGKNVELIVETQSKPYAMRIAEDLHKLDNSGTYVTKGSVHYAKYKGNLMWTRK